MPRYTQPRKSWKYTKEFKIKAVKLTHYYGVRVKEVARSLDIHPFMLSRWRKEYRDGVLQGDGKKRLAKNKNRPGVSGRELSENARLKKENEKLKMENDLLKKWQRYLAEQHQNDLDSSKDTEN
ncbi:hypothetical protein TDB9533_00721 [Thalassocella blandensis]|nr:hypothetical protein TDB9533_00721 [Thalassocella blandensis]